MVLSYFPTVIIQNSFDSSNFFILLLLIRFLIQTQYKKNNQYNLSFVQLTFIFFSCVTAWRRFQREMREILTLRESWLMAHKPLYVHGLIDFGEFISKEHTSCVLGEVGVDFIEPVGTTPTAQNFCTFPYKKNLSYYIQINRDHQAKT